MVFRPLQSDAVATRTFPSERKRKTLAARSQGADWFPETMISIDFKEEFVNKRLNICVYLVV